MKDKAARDAYINRTETRVYQIWLGAVHFSGEAPWLPHFVGSYYADSLKDAVRKLCNEHPEVEEDIHWDILSHGVRLIYDNEVDAGMKP